MPDIGNEKKKLTYRNARVKAFIFEDGTHTTSWRKAVNRFNKGEVVYMYVHVSGYGQWKTSQIESMFFSRGKRMVETKGHLYQMAGVEHAKRVKEVRFYVPGSTEHYLTSKVDLHLGRVLQYLQLGAEINCEVVYRDGSSHLTSGMIEYYPARRRFTSASYTVYKW